MENHTPAQLSRDVATGPPFRTRLFQSPSTIPAKQSQPSPSLSATSIQYTTSPSGVSSWESFPVYFRSGVFDEQIKVVDNTSLTQFLEEEFSLQRLDEIHSKLWRVGYPRPPRPLTIQIQFGRTPTLTNSLDMHLVWGSGKIFLKPLPRYLLEPEFWAANLSLGVPTNNGRTVGLTTAGETASSTSDNSPQSRINIRKSALGLLYTYACLISNSNDFKLALEYGLIPNDDREKPDWATWRVLAVELLHPNISSQVHRRFHRGELRLNRLNWIYIVKYLPSIQMYHNPWHTYTEFFIDNMSWVTATTIYFAIVLTAMQVGLSTDALQNNKAFQQASYGFSVFAILAPVIVSLILALVLLVTLIPNWISARSATRHIGSKHHL